MNTFLDDHAHIIYPDNYLDDKIKMFIYLSDNDTKYNQYINILKNNYNSIINNCYIGKIHKMIIVEDLDLLSLLLDLYTSDKNNCKGSIYNEFVNIYNNQDQYFNKIII